jgi:hypothetical protein
MKKTVIAMMILTGALILAHSVMAAETKVEGRLYGSWWMYMTDTVYVVDGEAIDFKGWNQFSLDRSYVTVNSKLTDYSSVNITTDLRSVGGYDGYTIVLKYGYANIKTKFAPPLSFTLGLQPPKFIEYNDGQVWGRRYIAKSIADHNDFFTTSDLGFTADYGLGENSDMGSVGLSIWNGTSYTDLTENNKSKDFNFYAAVKPLTKNEDFSRTILVGQIYLGTQNVPIDTSEQASDYKRQIISFSGKFNYRDYFDLGGEFWNNTLGTGAGNDDLKQTAISVYGALYFKGFVAETSPFKTLNLMVRYDIFDPNTDSAAGKNKKNWMIVGLECAPVKGINTAINYRSESFEESDKPSQNYLYFNTEFRF